MSDPESPFHDSSEHADENLAAAEWALTPTVEAVLSNWTWSIELRSSQGGEASPRVPVRRSGRGMYSMADALSLEMQRAGDWTARAHRMPEPGAAPHHSPQVPPVALEVSMIEPSSTPTQPRRFELRFDSLFKEGRAYVFPCDTAGHVNLDALSEAARRNYLFARAATGRDYAMPRVQLVPEHQARSTDLPQQGRRVER